MDIWNAMLEELVDRIWVKLIYISYRYHQPLIINIIIIIIIIIASSLSYALL